MKEQNSKKKKYVFRDFRYIECDRFAEYLHNMALKGWHFKDWSKGLVFEEGAPSDIQYTVEVFPKGTEMDTHPEPDAEEYAEYCNAAGWKLIDGKRKFCIFRREIPDAVPIVTEKERFQNIRQAEWKILLQKLAVPLFNLVPWWMQAFQDHFERWERVPGYRMVYFVLTAIVCFRFAECIIFFIWTIRAMKKLKEGEKIVYRSCFPEKLIEYILLAFLLISVLVMTYMNSTQFYTVPAIIMGICLFILFAAIAIIRPSRTGNWILQLVGGILIIYIFIISMTMVIFIS